MSAAAGSPSPSTSAYMVSSALYSQTNLSDGDEMASLPSSPTTSSLNDALSLSDDDDESDAEREWKESMEQLELMLTMVLVPFVGKFLGRKCAYWGWTKFMEWKYPVEVVMSSKTAFRGAGAIGAAASL